MNPHSTWFDFVPGYASFKATMHGVCSGGTWTWQMFQTTHFQLDHVMGALLVFLFLLYGAFRYRAAVGRSGDAA